MTQILYYNPGQQVTIVLETLDLNGARADGYIAPIVERIILPGLTLASGYPQPMNRIDVGLYYFQFILPFGAISIGSYIVDVLYENPAIGMMTSMAYQVVVNAVTGNFGLSSIG